MSNTTKIRNNSSTRETTRTRPTRRCTRGVLRERLDQLADPPGLGAEEGRAGDERGEEHRERRGDPELRELPGGLSRTSQTPKTTTSSADGGSHPDPDPLDVDELPAIRRGPAARRAATKTWSIASPDQTATKVRWTKSRKS